MGFFGPEFFSGLLSIVLMDLVLGGDNAIVIGMAARNLPSKSQKKVILLGTGGAVIIRTLATLIAVWLLKIPGLMLIGGIFLVRMAYILLNEDKSEKNKSKKNKSNIVCSSSFWGAVRTIIIADAVMGLDNVLAVAGAAQGSSILVVCGLMISIPIVVWGSTLVIKAINRFPIIITIGAAVIVHTAVKMMIREPFIQNYIGKNLFIEIGLSIIVISGVLLLSYHNNKQKTLTVDQKI